MENFQEFLEKNTISNEHPVSYRDQTMKFILLVSINVKKLSLYFEDKLGLNIGSLVNINMLILCNANSFIGTTFHSIESLSHHIIKLANFAKNKGRENLENAQIFDKI